MPFKSRAQQGWAFSNPSKLGGMAKVKEWADATNFKNLPERVTQKPKKRGLKHVRVGGK